MIADRLKPACFLNLSIIIYHFSVIPKALLIIGRDFYASQAHSLAGYLAADEADDADLRAIGNMKMLHLSLLEMIFS